jgi:hypothetical protein
MSKRSSAGSTIDRESVSDFQPLQRSFGRVLHFEVEFSDNSLGALFGFGVDKDFGAFSVGVKANAELVRFTTGNDPAGEAIWHRYNIQLDLGYSLFTGE